jgi:excisionase family DNA binding protein
MSTAILATKRQLAGLLGVSEPTVTNWVKKGIIPGVVPGTRRYCRAAVEAALQARNARPAETSPYDEWKRSRGQR